MSAEPSRERPRLAALEAAADWMDRYDTLPPGERTAFEAWMAESDENRRAFAAMESALLDDALRDAVELVRSAPEPTPLHAPGSTRPVRGGTKAWMRWTAVGLPIAAAVAGIAVFSQALLPARTGSDAAPDQPVEYATPIGARTDAVLKDRSVVHLDAASAVRVAFTDRARQIQLERGEAMFEVTHDPARPFDVDAAGATVTAVGTVFDVELIDRAVDVRVFRGVVRVRSAGGDVRLLHAGEQLALTGAHDAVFRRFLPDISQTWRSDWLQADNTPLQQVVARLNRYSPKPIVLKSGSLSNVALSGRFDLRRTDTTVTMISTLLGLDVVRDRNNIYLARKPS